jgi:uncharacterized protein YpmB
MSEGTVESPKIPIVSNSNSVTSFIEKNKWIIGGVVLLIVLFLLYKFYFKKAEKFNDNAIDDAIALNDSENFSQNEEINDLDGMKENYESAEVSDEN